MYECRASRRSRRDFLMQLSTGISAVSLLSACGGNAVDSLVVPTATGIPTFSDNARLQALMARNSVAMIRQGGEAVLRSDLKSNIALATHAARPFMIRAPGGGGGDSIDDDFAVEYDGVAIGGVSTAFVGGTDWNIAIYNSQDSINDYFDLLYAVDTPSGFYYGPVYTTPSPACNGNFASIIAAAAAAVYNWLQKAGAALLVGQLRTAWAAYGAEAITAEEFIGVALAILTAPELLAALASAAVVISLAALVAAIWSYRDCIGL